MKSLNVVFTGKEKVAVMEEPVEPLGPEEVLFAAEKSLISTGTELSCLKGLFDAGTNWSGWVQYPFHPGYSMAAKVVEVGKGVNGIQKGDRIACIANHAQFFKFSPEPADSPKGQSRQWSKIPEGVSDEDATFMSLACTAQLGVRRAELELGETVGLIGAGVLGQLTAPHLTAFVARKVIVIDPVQMRLDIANAH